MPNFDFLHFKKEIIANELIEAFLTKEIDKNGNKLKITSLPKEFTQNVTQDQLLIIANQIYNSNAHNYLKSKIIKLLASESKSNSDEIIEMLRNNHLWASEFIIPLKIKFGTEKINETMAKSIIKKLISANRLDTVCALIGYCENYSLLDFKSTVLKLASKNDINNLNNLLKNSKRQEFLKIVNDECKKLLNSRFNRFAEVHLNQYGKCARKLLLGWKFGELNDYPAIAVGKALGESSFIIRTVKETENSTGNPVYSNIELCHSMLDNYEALIKRLPKKNSDFNPSKIFKGIVCAQLSIENLGHHVPYFINGISGSVTKKAKLTLSNNSETYYTCSSPIEIIDTESAIDSLIEKLKSNTKDYLVGIDGEWHNSDLSIVQLCIDFDENRANFILDFLVLPVPKLIELFELLYKQSTLIGFACSQDLKKIENHLSFNLIPDKLVDIKNWQAKDCKSLDCYVNHCLKKSFDKRPRLSNWEKRPLRECQLIYAATDAEVLLDIYRERTDSLEPENP